MIISSHWHKTLRVLLIAALLGAALFVVTPPQPAQAQDHTSLKLSNITVRNASCDWGLELTVDITLHIPQTGAMASISWHIVTPETSRVHGEVLRAGPGPHWGTTHYTFSAYSTGSPLPHNSPITFIYRDIESSAEASITVDCTTGAIVRTGPNAPGPDLVPIPEQAVVGSIVQTTPLYYEPRESALTDTVMEAGKTLWIYGMDESGAYYKGMLAGILFWLPVDTVGPNYDEVWHGTPLPADVVD